jgi:hypothetical protein
MVRLKSRRSPVYNGNDDCRALVARCIRLGGRAAGTAAALPSYTLVSSAAGTTNRSALWHAEFSFHPRREWSGRGCDPSQQCCDHSGSVVCRSSPAVQFGLFQVGIGLLAACCPANTWRRAVFCARRHSDSLSSPIPGMDAGVWRLSVQTMRRQRPRAMLHPARASAGSVDHASGPGAGSDTQGKMAAPAGARRKQGAGDSDGRAPGCSPISEAGGRCISPPRQGLDRRHRRHARGAHSAWRPRLPRQLHRVPPSGRRPAGVPPRLRPGQARPRRAH